MPAMSPKQFKKHLKIRQHNLERAFNERFGIGISEYTRAYVEVMRGLHDLPDDVSSEDLLAYMDEHYAPLGKTWEDMRTKFLQRLDERRALIVRHNAGEDIFNDALSYAEKYPMGN